MLSLIDDIIKKFSKAGISSPRLETMMLIEAVTGEKNIPLNLSEEQKQKLLSFVDERLSEKPICKIIGNKDFYKYTFKVNKDVLSPRPDTEILVENAIDIIRENKFNNILEFGVGSGCIILSVLSEFKNISGVGFDISEKALSVAVENAVALNVSERIEFIKKSWFDNDLMEFINKKFDIIVSNPPYIPSADIAQLEKNVKKYDPLLALDGGGDGLRDYRRIADISFDILNDNGFILLEVGIDQSRDVADIFTKKGFALSAIAKDLAGIDRCIMLKKTIKII